MTYTLRVKKLKTTETDGKPDTVSVSAESTEATEAAILLTITASTFAEIAEIIPVKPGTLVELEIRPVRYGDIESYSGQSAALPDEEEVDDDDDGDPDEAGFIEEAAADIVVAGQMDPYTNQADMEARRKAWQASQQGKAAPDPQGQELTP